MHCRNPLHFLFSCTSWSRGNGVRFRNLGTMGPVIEAKKNDAIRTSFCAEREDATRERAIVTDVIQMSESQIPDTDFF